MVIQQEIADPKPPLDCNHLRQIHKQTFVEINGEWVKSTLEWMCIDCNHMGMDTPKEAFQGEWIPRKQEITRDDR